MRDAKLDILFEPLEMPNLVLKNRFFMAPMGTSFDLDRLADYLAARSRGEVGLIHTGVISVHPSGRLGEAHEPRLEKDEDIQTLVPLTAKVREGGAKIVAQLNHGGRYSLGRLLGRQPVAPSPIASRYTGETPRELTTEEVDDLVEAFAQAGLRARKAGFDGVEIVACSGYLVSQFLSPLTNKRLDKWGGETTLDRAAFALAVIREMRNLVGDDFNICIKFDGEDGLEGGKTLDDALILAPAFIEAGADRLHMWAGWHEAARPMLPMFVPRAAFTYISAAVKKAVDVPVATVGRINDPLVAADILAKGEADLIGLGRTLLCDPDFVKKTKEGRTREIRRCTACCYCFDQMMSVLFGKEQAELKCSFNPELGREGEGLVKPAEKKKRIVVVGGGPAGMEAARLAAVRGHQVTLFEKEKTLGGLLNLAVVPPHKEELKNIIDYYTGQMEILPIEVRLGQAFTPEKFQEMKPDAVVAAAGAEALIPDIPGVDGSNVVTALEVLQGKAAVGQSVVVIGGGLVGIETAEYLADQGRKVTVIEMLKSVAADIGPTMRWGVVGRARKKMTIHTLTKVMEIKTGGVVVRDKEDQEKEIPADTVVLAAGLKCRIEPAEFLAQTGTEYYVIGSCRQPGQVAQAIEEAFEVGCKI